VVPTQADILARMDRLSEAIYGHPGMFRIGKWQPGDGWTRYSITDRGGAYPFGERYYHKGELYECLGMAIEVAWKMRTNPSIHDLIYKRTSADGEPTT
jgi:hypothetical protein